MNLNYRAQEAPEFEEGWEEWKLIQQAKAEERKKILDIVEEYEEKLVQFYDGYLDVKFRTIGKEAVRHLAEELKTRIGGSDEQI